MALPAGGGAEIGIDLVEDREMREGPAAGSSGLLLAGSGGERCGEQRREIGPRPVERREDRRLVRWKLAGPGEREGCGIFRLGGLPGKGGVSGEQRRERQRAAFGVEQRA